MKCFAADQIESRKNWKQQLAAKVQSNAQTMAALAADACVPMNYYHPLSLIQSVLKQQRTGIAIAHTAVSVHLTAARRVCHRIRGRQHHGHRPLDPRKSAAST
jgi:hypothetical protein